MSKLLKKKVETPAFETEAETLGNDFEGDNFEHEEVQTNQEVEVVEGEILEADQEVGEEKEAQETVKVKTERKPEPVKEKAMTQATTTDVAVKPLNAVATPSEANANPTGALEWLFSQEEVASFGPGTFPKVTANNAGTLEIDREDLGKSIEVLVLSVNPRYVIVPGVDGDEAGKLVRYSYDGVTVENSEMSVEEYLTYLREEENYPKADVRTYADLWVNVLDNDEVDESEIVQIQLSPQSVGQWNALRTKMRVAQRRGVKFDVENLRLKITGERRKSGNNTWGIMKIDLA